MWKVFKMFLIATLVLVPLFLYADDTDADSQVESVPPAIEQTIEK